MKLFSIKTHLLQFVGLICASAVVAPLSSYYNHALLVVGVVRERSQICSKSWGGAVPIHGAHIGGMLPH